MNVLHTSKLILTIFALMLFLVAQTACGLLFDPGLTSQTSYGHLHLGISSDRSTIKGVGNVVHVRFEVKNTSGESVVIESKDQPVLDIVISVVDSGKTIRTWSSENPDKVLHRVEWKPGESKAMDLTWQVTQGEPIGLLISVSGQLNSDSKIVRTTGVGICLEMGSTSCVGYPRTSILFP